MSELKNELNQAVEERDDLRKGSNTVVTQHKRQLEVSETVPKKKVAEFLQELDLTLLLI